MSDINIGQITEALNDKTDRDMRNVDTTAGADAVIEYQEPTSENGYTWYRKHKSGWVEQGGYWTDTSQALAAITFPITMADTNYTATGLMDILGDNGSYTYFQLTISARNTTGMSVIHRGGYSGILWSFSWQVSGMAAQ